MVAMVATRHSDCVSLMRDASSYPDAPATVQVVETHISHVFLTDKYAYKLKKPVRFEFLDFSSTELRHRACLNEVRLNRRLAPDIYLDVLPITLDTTGKLALNGRGQPVDWVVQMRRLPANNALDVILHEKRLTASHIQAIAQHLTGFYARLMPTELTSDAYCEALQRHIRANGRGLLETCDAEKSRIRRVQSAQLRFLHIENELVGGRATGGRVVDGHGDLRPEHIYLNGRPTVIDCVEFSDELRTVDIADELSFLGMECERIGDGGLGERVLAEYEKACGDYVPESLLAFYRCYRASVRAKVAALRSEQQDSGRTASDRLAAEYLELAGQYARQLGPPLLMVVGGLMGSGKSTLAAKLADGFAIELLATDHIRHGLIGSSEKPAAYGAGNYRPDLRHRVYDELFRRAEELLANGESVVLDGTFLTSCLRNRAYNLAAQHGAVSLHVLCSCPREIAYSRIQSRQEAGHSESEARSELYDLQAQDLEPLRADEPAITIDTTRRVSQQFRAVCDKLKALI
jgi:aminoglycoside phosphotransferase family enzyme/predicted kinase